MRHDVQFGPQLENLSQMGFHLHLSFLVDLLYMDKMRF